MSEQTPLVAIIGGTGAQGMPIVKDLVRDGAYRVRIMTRNLESRRIKDLKAINPSNVEFVTGTFFSEEDVRNVYRGADLAFVNIDGFNAGEKAEIYWTIRAYELALEEGIEFYVHGNLDYVYKLSGFNPKVRTGHYDGKGRSGEWILNETRDNGKRMGAALFTTGPYADMVIHNFNPVSPSVEDGVVTWKVPIEDGKMALVDLDDCGYYVRWLFDNRDKANGMNLKTAIDFVDIGDLAKAFTTVTGKEARFVPVSYEEYWENGPLSKVANNPSAYGVKEDDPAKVTITQNFTGFWNVWRATKSDNSGPIRRDWKLLDEIHPKRTKNIEEWMRKEAAKGEESGQGSLWERVNSLAPFLKIHEDRFSKKPAPAPAQL